MTQSSTPRAIIYEEYYIYDPDKIELSGWCRQEGELVEIPDLQGWTSPRLGVRFELGEELQIFFPDSKPFLSFLETTQQAELANQRAEIEKQRADEAESRARLMAAKLAELGIDPNRLIP
jgi:hypothetical protein